MLVFGRVLRAICGPTQARIEFLNAIDDEVENGSNTAPNLRTENAKHAKTARKKLIRRHDRDYSQPLRLTVQTLFSALSLWIGVQFIFGCAGQKAGGEHSKSPGPPALKAGYPSKASCG